MSTNRYTLLVVDDDEIARRYLARLLKDEHYDILEARSGEEAVGLLRDHEIDLLLSDVRMPGINGFDVVSYAKRVRPDTVRLLITAHAQIDAAVKAIDSGDVQRFLLKPIDRGELRDAVARALQLRDVDRPRAQRR